ncbi:response regulator transcription factor [Oceanibium sediminis]|uniref:response regulator transcription factor n=1 Tax=Oceanibium sediminis TaxID=2026339 RepID=UPI000DD2F9C9|nr:response regulator transcription factor [Oceanibium sediminis]
MPRDTHKPQSEFGQKPVILIVDDEPEVAELVRVGMKLEGFDVVTAGSLSEMKARAAEQPISMFVLDVMLPDGSGIEIAREIRRKSDVGIVFLTGLADEIDTVVGLELGADDYIPKPFRLREMRARLNSVYRRTQKNKYQIGRQADDREEATSSDASSGPVNIFGWKLDSHSRSLTTPDGRDVELTTSEFDLLLALARNRGRVMTRNQLLDALRGDDWASYDRLIDGLVSRIRTKFADAGEARTIIRTVRGIGYMMVNGN